MIYGITDLTTFVLGTIFIVLLPGPNSLYVMTLASRRGMMAGYLGACGIFVGDTILMLLAVTGAASVLYASPMVFTLLKFAGAAYLSWLGIGLIRAGITSWRNRHHPANQQAPLHDPFAPTKRIDMHRPFRTALIISLLNPKAIMFFVSFFIQFVDPHHAEPGMSFLILGIIVQIISALYLSALIIGGAKLAKRFGSTPWLAASGKASVGLLFIGFAVKLAL
ncbi:MAG: leucine efflux protein LeuE [Burkholderiaceae bacterium]|nr:leucine efflux protein LeuE [Burkholderiaceae bacterium]